MKIMVNMFRITRVPVSRNAKQKSLSSKRVYVECGCMSLFILCMASSCVVGVSWYQYISEHIAEGI